MSLFFFDFDGKTLGDNAVSKMFQDMKLAHRDGWEKDMEERLQYYKGNQGAEFEELLRVQYPATYDQLRPFFFINIYRKFIDGMSLVYYEPPVRKLVKADDKTQELFDEIYDAARVNVIMKQGEAYSTMFQTAFVQWRWSEFRRGMALDTIEPQRFQVVQSIQEPLDLNAAQAVIVEMQSRTDTMNDSATLRYHYWSGGPHPLGGTAQSFIYNGKKEIEPWPDTMANANFINPYIDPATQYPIYPFVKLDYDFPPTEFFDIGGCDLLAAVKNFDLRLTDLMYGAKMQAFSIPVLIHSQGEEGLPSSIPFSPGLIMKIASMGDNIGDFRFETPDPKLQEILDMVVALVEMVGRLKGADPAAVKLRASDTPESGVSKQVDRGDAVRSRKNRLQYWRYYENEIAKKMMIIYNQHNPEGNPFSDETINAGIHVDFADVQAELDPTEKIELDRKREQDGLVSVVDRMIEYNPDLDRKAAMEKVKENIKENRDARGRLDPDKLFGDLETVDNQGGENDGE